jgi:hypothetical protein
MKIKTRPIPPKPSTTTYGELKPGDRFTAQYITGVHVMTTMEKCNHRYSVNPETGESIWLYTDRSVTRVPAEPLKPVTLNDLQPGDLFRHTMFANDGVYMRSARRKTDRGWEIVRVDNGHIGWDADDTAVIPVEVVGGGE